MLSFWHFFICANVFLLTHDTVLATSKTKLVRNMETVVVNKNEMNLYQSRRLQTKKNDHYTKGIEGPAADRHGKLYVTNFMHDGTIGMQSSADDFANPTIWWTLPQQGKSASVLVRSVDEIFVADYIHHIIYKIRDPQQQPEIFFQSTEMNQPNDMTMAADGTLYVSDPSWNSRKPGYIWKISSTGSLATKIVTQAKAANGIELSPDEKILYFTESIQGKLYACDLATLQKNKTTSSPKDCKLLVQFPPDTVDGIKTDLDGNIYIARIRQGKIDKYSPSGVLKTSILLKGKFPTNLAFGGSDGKSIFVTIRDDGSVETFHTPTAGRCWSLLK